MNEYKKMNVSKLLRYQEPMLTSTSIEMEDCLAASSTTTITPQGPTDPNHPQVEDWKDETINQTLNF